MYHRESGAVRHKFLGVDGIRVTGRQPFVQVWQQSGGVQTSLVPGAANVDSVGNPHTGVLPANGNYVELSPMELNGRLAKYGDLYQKYVFRRIRFVYTTVTSSTTNNSIAMAVTSDPSLLTGGDPPASFSEARMITPSCTIPVWVPQCILEYRYDGMDTWFNGFSTSNEFDLTPSLFPMVDDQYRSTSQALFCGFLSATGNVLSQYGLIDIEYEVEFYYPVLSSLSPYQTAMSVDRKSRSHGMLKARLAAIQRKESKKDQKSKVEETPSGSSQSLGAQSVAEPVEVFRPGPDSSLLVSGFESGPPENSR